MLVLASQLKTRQDAFKHSGYSHRADLKLQSLQTWVDHIIFSLDIAYLGLRWPTQPRAGAEIARESIEDLDQTMYAMKTVRCSPRTTVVRIAYKLAMAHPRARQLREVMRLIRTRRGPAVYAGAKLRSSAKRREGERPAGGLSGRPQVFAYRAESYRFTRLADQSVGFQKIHAAKRTQCFTFEILRNLRGNVSRFCSLTWQ